MARRIFTLVPIGSREAYVNAPPPEWENPYQSPKAYDARGSGQQKTPEYENLCRLAICQRLLLCAFIFHFVRFVGLVSLDSLGFRVPKSFVNTASWVGVLIDVTAVALLAVRLNGIVAGVTLSLLAAVPCANLIIMGAVYGQANTYFRRSGVVAGPFGPRWSDLVNATHVATVSTTSPAGQETNDSGR